MSGTFTPNPGAAPYPRQVAAQASIEARLLLRNGEQLLLALVIPVIVLIGLVVGAERLDVTMDGRPVDVFTPGVLALVIMSTSFTALAITTGFERRYGVLKRLGSSPLPRSGLLLGKVGALLMVQLLQSVVVAGVALALGWDPDPSWFGLVATALVGTAAFAAWGLFLAGVLRAEATLAAANVLYFLMLAGGAVVLPRSAYGSYGDVIGWLPSAALGDSMRAALMDGRTGWAALGVLAVWAVVGAALTARTFRWE